LLILLWVILDNAEMDSAPIGLGGRGKLMVYWREVNIGFSAYQQPQLAISVVDWEGGTLMAFCEYIGF